MTSSYVERIRKLDREFGLYPDLGYEDHIQEILLANLYHICPERSWSDILHVSRRLFRNQKRAAIDLEHLSELTPDLDVQNESGVELGSEPAIFCGSHYAGYRLIAPFLLGLRVPLTIVVDRHVAKAQSETFTEALTEHCRRLVD